MLSYLLLSTYVLRSYRVRLSQCKLDHLYLGLTLSDTMEWSHYITNISNKASKVLNFLRCNLCRCPEDVKVEAYLAIVRPLMEKLCLCGLGSTSQCVYKHARENTEKSSYDRYNRVLR